MNRRSFVAGCAAGAALAALPNLAVGVAAPGGSADDVPAGGADGGNSGGAGLPGTTAQVAAHFAALGIDGPRLQATLATGLERGGHYCDLFFEHSVLHQLALEDGVVRRASSVVTLGMGVRVLHGDSTGYAFTEELTPESLREAARLAATIAAGPGTQRALPLVGRDPAPCYPLAQSWDEIGIAAKVELLLQAQRTAAAHDPRIRKVSCQFVDEQRRLLIATSAGLLRGDVQPLTRCVVSCSARQGERQEENSFNLSARAGFDYYTPARVQRLGEEAARRTVALFEAVVPPAGEMPLVLAAGSSGILLHEAVGHGMEADFNRKGTSIFADRIGRPVARPEVTIVDDGTIPGQRGSIGMDDEGEDSARTVLVERGVLRSYLHDRLSAAHYGVAPTGNGRRESFRHLPLPRMRNTFMLPGPHSRDEILASVQRGLYAISFTNGQVQIGAGDFTFYVKSGYLIEDGRLTRPVKDVNIIGNGPQVLAGVSLVGDDLALDDGGWTCGKQGQGVPVSLGLPTVKVDRISVGGVNG